MAVLSAVLADNAPQEECLELTKGLNEPGIQTKLSPVARQGRTSSHSARRRPPGTVVAAQPQGSQGRWQGWGSVT